MGMPIEVCHLPVRAEATVRGAVVVLAGVNGRAGPLCKYAAALTRAHARAGHPHLLT